METGKRSCYSDDQSGSGELCAPCLHFRRRIKEFTPGRRFDNPAIMLEHAKMHAVMAELTENNDCIKYCFPNTFTTSADTLHSSNSFGNFQTDSNHLSGFSTDQNIPSSFLTNGFGQVSTHSNSNNFGTIPHFQTTPLLNGISLDTNEADEANSLVSDISDLRRSTSIQANSSSRNIDYRSNTINKYETGNWNPNSPISSVSNGKQPAVQNTIENSMVFAGTGSGKLSLSDLLPVQIKRKRHLHAQDDDWKATASTKQGPTDSEWKQSGTNLIISFADTETALSEPLQVRRTGNLQVGHPNVGDDDVPTESELQKTRPESNTPQLQRINVNEGTNSGGKTPKPTPTRRKRRMSELVGWKKLLKKNRNGEEITCRSCGWTKIVTSKSNSFRDICAHIFKSHVYGGKLRYKCLTCDVYINSRKTLYNMTHVQHSTVDLASIFSDLISAFVENNFGDSATEDQHTPSPDIVLPDNEESFQKEGDFLILNTLPPINPESKC